jgi:hypothetical protein
MPEPAFVFEAVVWLVAIIAGLVAVISGLLLGIVNIRAVVRRHGQVEVAGGDKTPASRP